MHLRVIGIGLSGQRVEVPQPLAATGFREPASAQSWARGNPYVYPDNLPRVNARGGPEGRPGCWQPITRDLWPAPYLVMDTGASIAPYNHFGLQPVEVPVQYSTNRSPANRAGPSAVTPTKRPRGDDERCKITETAPVVPAPEGFNMSAVQVVVADDDILLREGLASLLDRSGFEVVGQAADATELLALVRDREPQLVVVDIRMPPTHTTEGLDAARVIREELPDTGILVLSAHVDVEHATELLASGHGIGYLLKTRVTDVADFVDTLERISKGASVVDPALVQELVSARRRDDPLAVLSTREQEVLMLMAEGRSNAGIARRLWVTEGTVEKHVRSILTKLNLPETGDDHRRVLAVITYLEAR
jgi:DNA-binding NarL/FixJ family response regulator